MFIINTHLALSYVRMANLKHGMKSPLASFGFKLLALNIFIALDLS